MSANRARLQQSTYVTKIVTVDYSVTDGAIKLGKVDPDVWKMSPSNSAGLKAPLGLVGPYVRRQAESPADDNQLRSAVSSRRERCRTPVELPVENISKDKPAEVVTTSTGSPLTFTHKPEGVVVPGKGVMVLHDDDERLTTVEAPQSPRTPARSFISSAA